jgi:hypothetical protein
MENNEAINTAATDNPARRPACTLGKKEYFVIQLKLHLFRGLALVPSRRRNLPLF